MDLRTYLDNAPRGEAARLARDLDVSPVVISHWCSGRKPVPVDRAPVLERVTNGTVMRWHTRPRDWHEMWPELVGAEGAPAAPTEETQAQGAA